MRFGRSRPRFSRRNDRHRLGVSLPGLTSPAKGKSHEDLHAAHPRCFTARAHRARRRLQQHPAGPRPALRCFPSIAAVDCGTGSKSVHRSARFRTSSAATHHRHPDGRGAQRRHARRGASGDLELLQSRAGGTPGGGGAHPADAGRGRRAVSQLARRSTELLAGVSTACRASEGRTSTRLGFGRPRSDRHW